ncbi:prephenate dehydrogenase/arogenate dehydrogenase family protein [Thermococcus sp. 2319x1]|uniref:prephenate dehydrogenase/arogenate dehydrogenase family protein n=1 Tax=Thermococcus sp. 2319x1 TaxID=1674923 RepID=UPI0015835A5C|nr:prephenate dehydrogenase/arogenate dehydrogenase family protein [Thermococcus sp. 2319x1]
MRLGIAGYGRMGRLFERCLGGRFEVIFYSEHGRSDVESLEELYLKSDVVMVASSLASTPERLGKLAEISREYGGKKTVFDIATFKSHVIKAYTGFSEETTVASVHPMFGPGAKSIEGKRFIVVPIPGREEGAEKVADFIRSFGGKVTFLDWKTHDKMMGFVIGVPYFIGLSYLSFSRKLRLEEFGGTSWAFLETYGKAVLHDSPDFIRDVLSLSREQIEDFLNFLRENPPNPGALIGEFEREEIKEAYRRFYKTLE